jgi:hypothetical protein
LKKSSAKLIRYGTLLKITYLDAQILWNI